MKYLLVLSLIIISLFAFSPGEYTPALIVNHDKAVHTLTFYVLPFLLHRSFRNIPITQIIVFSILIGLVIELIQFIFTSRGFSLEDLMYDIVGVTLYVMTHMLMLFLQKSQR